MMVHCPHCGHYLLKPLSHGISSCVNCRQVFDSCRLHYLLSVAWLIRKHDIVEVEYLATHFNVKEDDAMWLISLVADQCLSPEEVRLVILKDYLDRTPKSA